MADHFFSSIVNGKEAVDVADDDPPDEALGCKRHTPDVHLGRNQSGSHILRLNPGHPVPCADSRLQKLRVLRNPLVGLYEDIIKGRLPISSLDRNNVSLRFCHSNASGWLMWELRRDGFMAAAAGSMGRNGSGNGVDGATMGSNVIDGVGGWNIGHASQGT